MDGHAVFQPGNRSKPPALAFANRFGRYAPETERDVRKVEVRDEALRSIFKVWESIPTTEPVVIPTYYMELLRAVKDIEYSAHDVERFVLALEGYQDEKKVYYSATGYFLSALINNCRDSDFTLNVGYLKITYLGYQNTKNIVINGSAGHSLGTWMKSGSITVLGDTDSHVACEMEGGEILVKGNASNNACYRMTGGKVVIEGNAQGQVGDHMLEGSVIVEGNAGFQAAYCMAGGFLWIRGDVGTDLGCFMKDGIVLVDGNAVERAGYKLKGGKIRISGNAGKEVGAAMLGGELHIDGSYESLRDAHSYDYGTVPGGRIYHAGRLIVGE